MLGGDDDGDEGSARMDSFPTGDLTLARRVLRTDAVALEDRLDGGDSARGAAQRRSSAASEHMRI